MKHLSLCAFGLILLSFGSVHGASSSPGTKSRNDLTSAAHEVATSSSAEGLPLDVSLSSGLASRPVASSETSESFVKPVEHLAGDFGIRSPSLPLRQGLTSPSTTSALSSFSPSKLIPSFFSSGKSKVNSLQRAALRPISRLLDLFPRYDQPESHHQPQHLVPRNTYPTSNLVNSRNQQRLQAAYGDHGINSLSSYNANEHLMKQGSLSQVNWLPYRGQAYPSRRSTIKSFFERLFG